MFSTLLKLQDLELRIEACKAREIEIPKQKGKFEVYRKRLAAELEEREKRCRDLALEQRTCESEVDQLQNQVRKYDQQLFSVKKNEEYQALLHEIEMIKKQIGIKEERILTIMEDIEDARVRLEEDRKRIQAEQHKVDEQCAAVDHELQEAIAQRKQLENQCVPLENNIDKPLLNTYRRIRKNKKSGAVLVHLNDEVCSGCNMTIPAQIVNEVMAGEKLHTCNHCGRLLYHRDNIDEGAVII